MKQVIIGGGDSSWVAGVTKYNVLMGSGGWVVAEAQAWETIPTGGIINRLAVKVNVAPGAGESHVFTVYKNGAPTTLTCTISGANLSASDLVNHVDVVAADTISIECVSTAAATAPGNMNWTTVFEGTTAGESIWLANMATNRFGVSYSPCTGKATNTNAEPPYQCPMPTAGTVKKLYVTFSAAIGIHAADGYIVGFSKNAVWPCTIIQTIMWPATTGNDVANTQAVVAGDLTALVISAVTGTETDVFVGIGLVLVAAADGDSVLFGGRIIANVPTGAVSYTYGCTGDETSATETDMQSLAGRCTMSAFYIKLGTAPGGATSYQIDLRVDAADAGPTVTIVGAATTGNDVAHSILVTDWQKVCLEITPTGPPAASTVKWGILVHEEAPLTTTATPKTSNASKMSAVGAI